MMTVSEILKIPYIWRFTGGAHGTQYIVAFMTKVDYSNLSKDITPDDKETKSRIWESMCRLLCSLPLMRATQIAFFFQQ